MPSMMAPARTAPAPALTGEETSEHDVELRDAVGRDVHRDGLVPNVLWH
jgi:hypothetical protein